VTHGSGSGLAAELRVVNRSGEGLVRGEAVVRGRQQLEIMRTTRLGSSVLERLAG